MIKLLEKFYRIFFHVNYEKRLYSFFRKTKKKTSSAEDTILVQCVEDLYYYSLFGTIINELNEDKKYNVEQYIVRNLVWNESKNVISCMKKYILYNKFRDHKWTKLYSSYVHNIAYSNSSSNFKVSFISFFNALKFYKNIQSKKDVLEITFKDIYIGDLIYDSYLRFKSSPTLYKDLYLFKIIWLSFKNINIINKYFELKKPCILLTSYSTYIQHGISVRIALKHKTKVYSFGNFNTFTKLLTLNDFYHTSNFWNYKKDFLELINMNDKLIQAEAALDNRINGKIDLATSYMKESAYGYHYQKIQDVKNSIIIFLHDFFDSPHCYGKMVFCDFYEWIEYTIDILEKYQINFFLKPHPNQINDSKNVVELLKRNHPNVKFLTDKVSNKQLAEAGIRAGVTVYGTIAHELVYLGVPVITCADNPHSSYNFCLEAKSKEEYTKYLLNVDKFKILKQHRDEVKSFYFMHNLNKTEDEIVLIKLLNELRDYNYEKFSFKQFNDLINKLKNNRFFINYIKDI